MSTRKIRQALRLVDANAFPYQGDRNDVRTLLTEALAEVERIEQLAKVFEANGISHPWLREIAEDAP